MKRLYLAMIAVLSVQLALAQYHVENDKSTLIIMGSSNLTDWNQFVDDIHATLDVEQKGSTILAVNSLDIIIPVEAIKSGQHAMDENAYKALKGKDFPLITYRLLESSISNTDVTLRGIINVAGEEKEIEIHTTYSSTSRLLVLSGELKLKMTDFGIEPPSALMGVMKTNDDLLLEFSLVFER